ncbi:hypothetical protein BOX15_Mlig033760g4, partial [Macrostomum lignano]
VTLKKHRVQVFRAVVCKTTSPLKTMSDSDIPYLPSHWSKRLDPTKIVDAHFKLLREQSELVIERLKPEIVQYGQSDSNELVYYWFTPSDSGGNAKSPLFVFIHGGYWQTPELTARMCCHMADTFVNNGLHFASLGYDCVPAVSIEDTVRLVETGLRACLERARSDGLSGVYVAGHSAGGHLAVTAGACVHWPGELAGLIKGVLPISGVFDLMPLVKTSVNHPLGMNTARAAALSPMRGLQQQLLASPVRAPILAIVGALESPEFTRQSRELCDLLRRHGRQADVNIVPERDHFDIIELLADPADSLSQRILAFIRSGGVIDSADDS